MHNVGAAFNPVAEFARIQMAPLTVKLNSCEFSYEF